MYDTIVVPTDGSEQARRGVEAGIDIAAEHDAGVVPLYVVDERRYGETPALTTMEVEYDKIEQAAIEHLEEIAESARERGLSVEYQCHRGIPWEDIIETAESVDADLIVMGRRGATNDRATPLGSVTERVLRKTEIPVQAV